MTWRIDVLVIDDDKFSQKLICHALSEDFVPRMADDGESGIASALETVPDIILLDVEMPDINGYEVCDRPHQNASTQQIPIVFLSSHTSLRERMQGYEVGADDYLVKLFEPEALVAKLLVIFKYRQQQRAGPGAAARRAKLCLQRFRSIGPGLFTVTDWLGLNCCMQFFTDKGDQWFSSSGSIKPLEMELMSLVSRTTASSISVTATSCSIPTSACW